MKVGSVTDARLRARALRGGQLTYLDRVKLRLGSGTNSIPVGAERVAGASANVLRLKEMSGADGNPNRMPIGPRRMLPPVAVSYLMVLIIQKVGFDITAIVVDLKLTEIKKSIYFAFIFRPFL